VQQSDLTKTVETYVNVRDLDLVVRGEVTILADDNGFLRSDEPWDCIDVLHIAKDEPGTPEYTGGLTDAEMHAVNAALYRKAVGNV
jgi:hypothetical protein